ncbi:MAG: GIY-YIG nuclease family protein [Candidatus Acidiferrales bacterium]
MTNHLVRRICEHKQKPIAGFTRRYDVTRLVHFEICGTPSAAIAREKQIKSWRRSKKLTLISSTNPKWDDLSKTLFSRPSPAHPNMIAKSAAKNAVIPNSI